MTALPPSVRILIGAAALALAVGASPVSIDSIPIAPGSGKPFHVTITDLKDNPLLPDVLNWQVTAGHDIGVIPDESGFNISAPATAVSGTADIVWTYKPNPKISIKKPIFIKEPITGLKVVSP